MSPEHRSTEHDEDGMSGSSGDATTSNWFKRFALGGLAGLLGGLALVLLQGLARLGLGVFTPMELIGDRAVPIIGVNRFFDLLNLFGNYNVLKQFGVSSAALGEVVVFAVIGMGYARYCWKRGVGAARTFASVATGVVLLAGVIVLWPLLDTSAIGLAPVPARLLTLTVMAVTFAAGAALTAFVYDRLDPVLTMAPHDGGSTSTEHTPVGRRAVLAGGAGLGLAAATGGVTAVLFDRATFSYDGTENPGPGITPLTANEDFYIVTKNVIDPRVIPGIWRLSLGGHVDNAISLDLAALRERGSVQQETTLMCISNGVGQSLMSNAMWTGVPLAGLLDEAGVREGAQEIFTTGVDGYSDSFSIDKAMDPTTMVVYQMNGEDLPRRHGFPARLIVPGMFGEKHVKWIQSIAVVDRDVEGFYEAQGYGPNFEVPTRSQFTAPSFGHDLPPGETIMLAGTAYGGSRGISMVEVSTDDGQTFEQAEITYEGTEITWSLWQFPWTPDGSGEFNLQVRATDGNGDPQITERRGIVPEGATGIHTVTAKVA